MTQGGKKITSFSSPSPKQNFTNKSFFFFLKLFSKSWVQREVENTQNIFFFLVIQVLKAKGIVLTLSQ